MSNKPERRRAASILDRTGYELEVEDRGSGVGEDALARPASPGHLGFLTMAQRAAKLGAELTVADRPEGGTRVRVTWLAKAVSPAGEGVRAAAT